jgi:hypothetical protein
MKIVAVSTVFVVGLIAGLIQMSSGAASSDEKPVTEATSVSESPTPPEKPEQAEPVVTKEAKTVAVLDMVSSPEEQQPDPADSVQVPAGVRAKIEASAARRHADNFSTQVFVINNELKAYRELQVFSQPSDIPDKVFRTIRREAAERHPDTFSTQLFVINNELKAYRELQDFGRPADIPESVFYRIARSAAQRHRDNYSTLLFVIKNELKAYRSLQAGH